MTTRRQFLLGAAAVAIAPAKMQNPIPISDEVHVIGADWVTTKSFSAFSVRARRSDGFWVEIRRFDVSEVPRRFSVPADLIGDVQTFRMLPNGRKSS